MKIFISSNIWFTYNDKENSKIKTSYQRDILHQVFWNITNYIERYIKEIISNRNYGAWLININVIFLCHSQKLLHNIKAELWETEYLLGFGDRFRHKWNDGGGFIRIDAKKWICWDFQERVELMFDGIKRATIEVKKIMDSRKSVKKEFDIDAFFKDLDVAKENTLKIAKEK